MHEALADLADRWRRARESALRAFAPADTPPQALLATALARAPADAERRVFENSLRLGRGFSRTFRVELTLRDLREVLTSLGLPCLHGAVHEADGALFVERRGCVDESYGPAACDFLREAIAGLTLGITGGIRHARHESRGHGGASCIDFFHVDPESALRFGPIPPDARDALASVSRLARMFDSASEVTFLGVAEGVLSYRVDKRSGPSDVSVRALVEREVKRKLPALSLLEVSPRSVMAEGA